MVLEISGRGKLKQGCVLLILHIVVPGMYEVPCIAVSKPTAFKGESPVLQLVSSFSSNKEILLELLYTNHPN